MKVSVALCTYNGAAFLKEQLQSIAQQSILPDELIIGDDGSTDNTISIIQAFQANASFPVTLIQHSRRLGVKANFFETIHACSGQIVFLADQDDVWKPNKIEEQLQLFQGDNVAFTFTNAELSNASQSLFDIHFPFRIQRYYNHERLLTSLTQKNMVTGATAALRKDFFERYYPFPTTELSDNILHDSQLHLLAILDPTVTTAFTSKSLMTYRVHSGQQVGIDTTKQGIGAVKRNRTNYIQSFVDWADLQTQLAELVGATAEDKTLIGSFRAFCLGRLSNSSWILRLVFLVSNFKTYVRLRLSKEILRDLLP
ncbi:MAG: glycosyltransferase [Saprospiraceae bacterium]|nr:glycosyltransferase [Saprospiraceae bacterium]